MLLLALAYFPGLDDSLVGLRLVRLGPWKATMLGKTILQKKNSGGRTQDATNEIETAFRGKQPHVCRFWFVKLGTGNLGQPWPLHSCGPQGNAKSGQ